MASRWGLLCSVFKKHFHDTLLVMVLSCTARGDIVFCVLTLALYECRGGLCTSRVLPPCMLKCLSGMYRDDLDGDGDACRKVVIDVCSVAVIGQGEWSGAGDSQPAGFGRRAGRHERFEPHAGLAAAYRSGAVQP